MPEQGNWEASIDILMLYGCFGFFSLLSPWYVDVCTVCYDARLAEEQKEKLRFDDATVYVRLVDENPNEVSQL